MKRPTLRPSPDEVFDHGHLALNEAEYEKAVEAYQTFLQWLELQEAKQVAQRPAIAPARRGYDDPLFDAIAKSSPAAASHVAAIRAARDDAAAAEFVAALQKRAGRP
ncbi:hypothetical protein EV663_102159 [Rhodovulum bhavnagarense]|uniref:Uncharacterized protein n=1 Tax=Rhodovulum bhavnagarense TaxID=992286 RepID=A0A4R2RT55_9RHOB|nr:hypothetical protein [Rhodovulum bhavnagarense]TCP62315.1 hypothetical protein EV663_102159 [Rhodovulum bhavnagarense]